MRVEGTPRLRAVLTVALLVGATMLFGSATARASSPNLIVNGSFESGYPGSYQCRAGLWYPVNYNSACPATIPGWTAVSGVDWSADGSLGLPAEDGNLAVDLDSDSAHAPGSLTQSVATTAGAPYELTYWYSANWQCNQGVRNGQVSVAGLTQQFSINTAEGSQPWFEETLDFVATDASTAITFASLSGGNCGVAIDDVQLYQSGPSGGAKTVPAYASQGPSAGYNPTGVTLTDGQQVTVTASGTWDVCGGNCPSDADGVSTKHNSYLDPSAPAGELVGSLDGGATWFAIGVGPTTVTGPGTLILAANDYSTNFGDNSGRLDVSISAPVTPDTTPPTIVAAATTSPNANGWYSGDVTVQFTCSDDDSGIPAGACPADQVLTGEGSSISSLAETVTDAAGNTSAASNVVTVSIDRTAPTVTYSSSGETYDVNDTVSIMCTPADALSGIDSSTCEDVSAPAWTLGLGTHDVSATATDKAGNVGSGSASYTVRATANGVCALVQAWESKDGVASSLCAKLKAAAASRARGNGKAADNQLAAFRNELDAQSGKSISAAHVATLESLSHAL